MQLNRRTLLGSAGLIAGTVAVSVLGVTAPALAGSGPVSTTPASGTPALPGTPATRPSRSGNWRQCGGTMYAVGSFTTVNQGGVSFTRHNAFSFSATAPYKITSWAPDIDGKVNSIAFNGTGFGNAYLGGIFTNVNAQKAEHIIEVSASTGKINFAFAKNVNGQVNTLVAYRGRILAGGNFTSANGGSNKYFAALNATTGKDDNRIHLNISGNYGTSGVTKVYNQQLSHGGTLDLAEGIFTSVGGQPRQQIFMLNLGGIQPHSGSAQLTGWTSPEFSQMCASDESFYVRAASWSPSDGTVYIGTTGYHPPGDRSGRPRAPGCATRPPHSRQPRPR